MANEIGQRFIAVAQVLILGALVFVGWQVHRIQTDAPKLSGVVLEWTISVPGKAPVKITLDLLVGETREQWQLRLHEALQRVEDIK